MRSKSAFIQNLLIIALLIPVNSYALTIPYVGFAYGPSTSGKPEQFEANSNMYAYLGIQTEYLLTYEIGFSSIAYTRFNSTAESHAGNMLMGSAMFHMPVEDSSLFIRFGFAAYQYYNQQLEVNDVFITVYGAGFDLAVSQKVSLRIEWQRHNQLEYYDQLFDVESIHGGVFIYF